MPNFKTLSAAAAIVFMNSAALAGEDLNWTPETYAEFEATILASADAEEQPIVGVTIGPKAFAEEVADGRVVYLTFMRTPFNIDGAPENVKEAFVREEYVRNQTVMTGSEIEGTRTEAPYRSLQKSWVVNCDTRESALNGYSYFEGNEVSGRAQHFVEGTLKYSDMNMSANKDGSVGASLVKAVCDGTYIYTPKD